MSSLFDRMQVDTVARRWIERHLDYPHDEWCLFWPFGLNQGGYAHVGGDKIKVHRMMCERKNGPAPAGKPEACHECGNGHLGCVNPNHLQWKSHGDNMSDMFRHGRHQKRFKLTPEQVDEIRSLEGRARIIDIANQFGVMDTTIRQIHSGKIWKDTSSRQVRVFSEDEVHLIRSTPWQVKPAKQFALEFGVHHGVIERIRAGTTYKWVLSSPHPSQERQSHE